MFRQVKKVLHVTNCKLSSTLTIRAIRILYQLDTPLLYVVEQDTVSDESGALQFPVQSKDEGASILVSAT